MLRNLLFRLWIFLSRLFNCSDNGIPCSARYNTRVKCRLSSSLVEGCHRLRYNLFRTTECKLLLHCEVEWVISNGENSVLTNICHCSWSKPSVSNTKQVCTDLSAPPVCMRTCFPWALTKHLAGPAMLMLVVTIFRMDKHSLHFWQTVTFAKALLLISLFISF